MSVALFKAPELQHYPHGRRFGVEIEFGFPGGWGAVRDLLGFAPRSETMRGWSVGVDGSGVELRTPPLQGLAGFQQLRDTMNLLKEYGAWVTEEDGLHVHHDAPEFISDPRRCVQLVRSWVENKEAIYDMVAPRRHGSWACPEWDQYGLAELERWAAHKPRRTSYSYYDDEYLEVDRMDLNIASVVNNGTIEFRLHEGTLDADVAIAWIKFGQKFIQAIMKRTRRLSEASDARSLLSRIRLSPDARATLLAKQRYGYDTPQSAYKDWDDDYDDEELEERCNCEMCRSR